MHAGSREPPRPLSDNPNAHSLFLHPLHTKSNQTSLVLACLITSRNYVKKHVRNGLPTITWPVIDWVPTVVLTSITDHVIVGKPFLTFLRSFYWLSNMLQSVVMTPTTSKIRRIALGTSYCDWHCSGGAYVGPCKQEHWTGNGQFCSAINCNNRRKICTALSFFCFPVNEERCVYWVKRYNYDIMLKEMCYPGYFFLHNLLFIFTCWHIQEILLSNYRSVFAICINKVWKCTKNNIL